MLDIVGSVDNLEEVEHGGGSNALKAVCYSWLLPILALLHILSVSQINDPVPVASPCDA